MYFCSTWAYVLHVHTHAHVYVCFCVCAFLCVHAQWLLVSMVFLMAFSNRAELKSHCQMGIFQGQQNCENKRGPQKGPELCSIVKLNDWTA